MQSRTVMVLDNTHHGLLTLPSDPIVRYLNKSGIRRVVVGHKPMGDSPAIARGPGIEIVDADTSYSDTSAADNRGIAVSEVLINGTAHSNQTHVHGVLHDGRAIDFRLPPVVGDGKAHPHTEYALLTKSPQSPDSL